FPTGNSTSTTGPMIWTTVPTLLMGRPFRFLFQGRGSRDDLDELFRDARLPRAVVDEGQGVDHVARVLGSGVHRRHLRREESRLRLEDHAVHLELEEARQERAENLLGRRLVQVVRAARR